MKHWFVALLLFAGCALATAQTANVNGLPPLATGASATPTPNPNFFKHIVYIMMENRSTDSVFAGDANLRNEGANLSTSAPILAYQRPGLGIIPNCTGLLNVPNVPPGCWQTFNYPLTHVPLTWGAIGNGIPVDYDMGHTNGDWKTDYGNNRQLATNIGQTNFQNPNPPQPNSGWGDLCAAVNQNGQNQCAAPPTPSGGGQYTDPSYATCKDGNGVNGTTPGPDADCSPGPQNTGCPTASPIPPTPTPFPGGSPSPSPFPPGFQCGLQVLNATDAQPYYTLAESYAFLDAFFQPNQSPSFPSHLYYTAGAAALDNLDRWPACLTNGSTTCNYVIANIGAGAAGNNPSGQAGCDAPTTPVLTQVATLDVNAGGRTKLFPCSSMDSIFNLLDAKSITSAYYATQDNAPLHTGYRIAGLGGLSQYGCTNSSGTSIGPSVCSANFTRIYKPVPFPSATPWISGSPAPNVIADINSCSLAQVVFLTPNSLNSDHGAVTDGSGPAYLATVVNAIGQDSGSCGYWGGAQNTLIVVAWDDWGGLYDHVGPTIINKGMYGFRVGGLCISAYSGANVVDHTQYTFGSVLHTIENNFALGASLGVDDTNTPLSSTGGCYNTLAMPSSYTPVVANLAPNPPEHIAAIRRFKPNGEWYWDDLTPKAYEEAFFERRMATDKGCVDECKAGAL